MNEYFKFFDTIRFVATWSVLGIFFLFLIQIQIFESHQFVTGR
jgi:hypothetical protein